MLNADHSVGPTLLKNKQKTINFNEFFSQVSNTNERWIKTCRAWG